MNKKLEKMFKTFKRDLDPDKIDFDVSHNKDICMMETDSCIHIADNNKIIVRLSHTSPKTAYVVIGMLMQILNKDGREVLMHSVEAYNKYCDESAVLEAEDILQPLVHKVLGPSSDEKFKTDMKEHIEQIKGDSKKPIIQVMLLQNEHFREELFETFPDFQDVQNIKVIMEE